MARHGIFKGLLLRVPYYLPYEKTGAKLYLSRLNLGAEESIVVFIPLLG